MLYVSQSLTREEREKLLYFKEGEDALFGYVSHAIGFGIIH